MSKTRSKNSNGGAQRRSNTSNRPTNSRAEAAARKPVNKQSKKHSKKKAPPMLKQNKLILILSVIVLGLCLIFPDVLAVLSPALANTLRILSIIGIVAALVANYYNVTVTEGIGRILPRRDDNEDWDEEEWEDDDDWDEADEEFEDEFEEEEEEAPPVTQPRRRRPAQQPVAPAPVALKKCSCGADLPEKAKFCLECGKAVPQKHVCAGCGAELPENAKFCLECGKPVAAAAAPASAPAARPANKPQATKPEVGKK